MVLKKRQDGDMKNVTIIETSRKNLWAQCTYHIMSFQCSAKTLIQNITSIIYQIPMSVMSKRKIVGKYVSHNSRFLEYMWD